MKELFLDIEKKMKHALDHFHDELKTLRTGRASLAMLDGIMVDYYGTPTPLNQVAGLSVPEATMIVAQVYDPSAMAAVEKAIMQSDLGLNPSNDGNIIRLVFPALTEERRKELIKVVRHEGENARVAVRNVRRDAIHHLKELLKQKKVAEDER